MSIRDYLKEVGELDEEMNGKGDNENVAEAHINQQQQQGTQPSTAKEVSQEQSGDGSQAGGDKPISKEEAKKDPEGAKQEVKRDLEEKRTARGKIPMPGVKDGILQYEIVYPFGTAKTGDKDSSGQPSKIGQKDYAAEMVKFFEKKEDRVKRFSEYGIQMGWDTKMDSADAAVFENLINQEPDFYLSTDGRKKLKSMTESMFPRTDWGYGKDTDAEVVYFAHRFLSTDKDYVKLYKSEIKNYETADEIIDALKKQLENKGQNIAQAAINALQETKNKNEKIFANLLMYAGYANILENEAMQNIFLQAAQNTYYELWKPYFELKKKNEGTQDGGNSGNQQ